MHTGMRLTCFTAVFMSMVLSLSSSSILPEISKFYEDYNFVASFSTPSERDTLIDCFSRDILPEDIRTDRMNRVFRLMKKLYTNIARIDPEMIMGPRTMFIKYFFHPELMEIKKIEQSSEKAVVEIQAYSVDPEFVNRYIQQFESNQDEEKKVTPDEERIESIKGRIVPRTEFHIWLFQNGKWMKTEHKNIYIKR
jgi:hypothetical protein